MGYSSLELSNDQVLKAKSLVRLLRKKMAPWSVFRTGVEDDE